VITVTTPLAVDGSTLSLVRGDDYLVAEGRALTFTSTGWEDLTSADPIELTIRRRAEAFGSGSDPVIFTVEDHVASRSVPPGSTTSRPLSPAAPSSHSSRAWSASQRIRPGLRNLTLVAEKA
jgi:hypothetical protein